MKNTRNNNNNKILLWIIILFGNIDSSYQTVYSCNTSELCGCSTNSAILTKIVGGESASTATWSWAVSISIAGSYLCGGSIVSSSWVITAAHCVKDFQASQITIYAGSILRWSGSQNRVASHIFVHPDYNSVSYVNDIALLHLTSPLIMSDSSVSAICLQFVQSTVVLSIEEWPPANTTVITVGWGILSESGSLSASLQQVTLQTINRQGSTCSPLLRNSQVQLCAGVSDGSKDACYGDSGGPLMMFTSNHRWVLVGVTSSGVGCARAGYSGVYARVAAYENWIKSTMNGTYSMSGSSALNNSQISFYYFSLFILSIVVIAILFRP